MSIDKVITISSPFLSIFDAKVEIVLLIEASISAFFVSAFDLLLLSIWVNISFLTFSIQVSRSNFNEFLIQSTSFASVEAISIFIVNLLQSLEITTPAYLRFFTIFKIELILSLNGSAIPLKELGREDKTILPSNEVGIISCIAQRTSSELKNARYQ
jgi:hypothetical protein